MAAVYSTGNSVLKKLTGVDLQKIGENALSINKEYDKNNSFKKIIAELQKHLKHITDTMPIIFIIDELDRCMPEYAIKVLERIHHIFHGFENVIVLLSVDRTQLDYSIKNIFGDNTDIDGYLKKFVDFTIKIDSGIITDNWEERFSEDFFKGFNISDINSVKLEIKPYLSLLHIREIEKIFNKISVINSSIKGKSGYILDDAVCIFEIIYAITNEKFKYDNELNWIKENLTYNNDHYFKYENISNFNNNINHELDEKLDKFSSLIKKKHKDSIIKLRDGSLYLDNKDDALWYGLFYYVIFNEKPYKFEHSFRYDIDSEFDEYLQTVEYIDEMYQLL